MCELDSCCFCIGLRAGSITIGYLSLVGSAIITLLAILGIAAGVSVIDEQTNDDTQTVAQISVIVLSVLLVIIVINLIFDIALLIGLHKNRRGPVRAYIIYTTIYIVLSVVLFISNFVIGKTVIVGNVVRDVITLVLNIYFLMVVKSYYTKMDETPTRVIFTASRDYDATVVQQQF